MNELPPELQPAVTNPRAASDQPQVGDILIRGLKDQRFTLLDVVTSKFLSGPFDGFPAAEAAARARRPRMIWRQNVDERGRALGELFPLQEQA